MSKQTSNICFDDEKILYPRYSRLYVMIRNYFLRHNKLDARWENSYQPEFILLGYFPLDEIVFILSLAKHFFRFLSEFLNKENMVVWGMHNSGWLHTLFGDSQEYFPRIPHDFNSENRQFL